ncbi:MAG: hypothetical protein U0163_17795 [Gemmatimonadaceae bacterium]
MLPASPNALSAARRGRGAPTRRAPALCGDSSLDGYERTRRFYEHAGYVAESRIRDFYRPGDDRFTYVKRF